MNLRRIGAVLVVMGLAAAACGKAAEVVAPRIAVRQAAQSTFDDHRGRFTLSLVGDADDLAALGTPTEEDRKVLEVLLGSRLVVSVDGGDETTLDDDAFSFDVDLGDVDHAIEVRMVDKVLYLRGDAAGLARLVEAKDGALPELVAGAQQAGLDFVADFVAGKWVSVDLGPLEAMAQGAMGAPASQDDLGAGQFQKILDAVSATFGEDVDVQRLGSEDAGTHYRLTVPVRRVYERLAPVFGELFPMPGVGPLPSSGEIPDRTVSLDLWVEDERVRRVELDLGQFAPEPPAGRVALRVDIDELDGAIKAPGDAVPVNFMQLLSQLMGSLGAIPS